MDFLIRRADKNDAPALAEILTQSWKAAYADIVPPAELNSAADSERYTAAFTAMTQNPSNTVLIAHGDGVPCGMLFYCPARDTDLSGYAEIVALYTLPQYWGNGPGQLLMKRMLAETHHAYSGAALWVFRDNARARRFYEKFGFVPDGKQKQENFSNRPQSVRYTVVFSADDISFYDPPDDVQILRAFFSENRERRVLVYRRKDGTYSYIDQTLTFDEYEQEYRWRGADNELSFYGSEESVLYDISPLLADMHELLPPDADARK